MYFLEEDVEEMGFFEANAENEACLAKCKAQGERAVERMSAKAREGYVAGGGEITVYEYSRDGATAYAMARGDHQADYMSFVEVEDMLELIFDAEHLVSVIWSHDRWTDCVDEVMELCELADRGIEWVRAFDALEDVIYQAAAALWVEFAKGA